MPGKIECVECPLIIRNIGEPYIEDVLGEHIMNLMGGMNSKLCKKSTNLFSMCLTNMIPNSSCIYVVSPNS